MAGASGRGGRTRCRRPLLHGCVWVARFAPSQRAVAIVPLPLESLDRRPLISPLPVRRLLPTSSLMPSPFDALAARLIAAHCPIASVLARSPSYPMNVFADKVGFVPPFSRAVLPNRVSTEFGSLAALVDSHIFSDADPAVVVRVCQTPHMADRSYGVPHAPTQALRPPPSTDAGDPRVSTRASMTLTLTLTSPDPGDSRPSRVAGPRGDATRASER